MRNVTSVMRECRNFFETGCRETEFTISGGVLNDDLTANGQYIAISGSFFNDGVHRVGDENDVLTDETFKGRVWYLHPPRDFLDLCEKIDEFRTKTPVSAYQSESFGEYRYDKALGRNGYALTWQEAFSRDLIPFRKMFPEVEI